MSQATEQIARQYANAAINKQQWSFAYNALAEGLVGDGVTDDTAALQALINKAIAAERRTIIFPHGEYYVTAITNAEQVDFIGDNSTFVGGYTGTISNIGGSSEIQAESVTRGINVMYPPAPLVAAAGDGIVDDRPAIQACIDYVVAAGGGSIFFPTPSVKYRCTSGLVVNGDDIFLVGNAILEFELTSGVAVDFNNGSTYQLGGGISGGLTIQLSAENWSNDTTGLRLRGHQRGSFREFDVLNFQKGLHLQGAYNQGCVFNNMSPRNIFNNKRNIYFSVDTSGWCNENWFFGGALSCKSGRAGGYADTYNVYIDNFTTVINDNKFFGTCFESASATTVAVYCEGTYNFFFACRFETSKSIILTSNSGQNVIMYGNDVRRSDITDSGVRNVIYSREGMFIRGGTFSDEAAAKFMNSASAAYPGVSILNPADLTEVIRLLGNGGIEANGEIKGSKFTFKTPGRSLNYVAATPEASVTSSAGGLAVNGSGGAGNTLFAKESGTGNTGWRAYQGVHSGTTAQRPTGIPAGYEYFDTSLGKPVWFKTTGTWVDATGATV